MASSILFDPTPSITARANPVSAPQSSAAFGSGIAQAAGRLGQAISGFGEVRAQREQQKQDFLAQQKFMQFETGIQSDVDNLERNMNPTGDGFAKNALTTFDTRAQEFLGTLPEGLREEYSQRVKTYGMQRAVTWARKEREQWDTYQTTETGTMLDKLATGITQYGQGSLDGYLKQGEQIINSTSLPTTRKEQIVRAWKEKAQVSALLTMSPEERRRALGETLGVDIPKATSSVVDRIIGVESGGNPNAKNPNSSATGAGQFIDSTWLSTVKKYRPDVVQGRSDAEILALRNNGELSREMTQRYTEENAASLQSAGLRPTAGNIYLAHFLGPQGAIDMLKADPNALAKDVNPSAAKANASIFSRHGTPKTAAQIVAWAERKMGGTGTAMDVRRPISEGDARFADIPLETRLKLINQADNQIETATNQRKIETRAAIEIAIDNAPSAIQNTGEYSGRQPSMEDFMDAYGPDQGEQKYRQYEAAVETSRQSYDMRMMPAGEIKALLEDAQPTSTGDTAAIDAQRYQVLSKAADATLKAREADPASYVRQVFPDVDRAWQNIDQPGGYQAALAVTTAAQQQLGIENMKLLPDQVSTKAVAAMKDDKLPGQDRLNAVANLVFSTSDPSQRSAVFNQLVEDGLAPTMEGVFEAMARGDRGAASRLMEAVISDPAKLPSDRANTPAMITENIYTNIWSPGEVGFTAYGMAYGDASSLERAQRGTELLNKAVRLRMSRGDDMQTAIDGAKKDLFGDKVVFDGMGDVNADLAIPSDMDQGALNSGLSASRDLFRQALVSQRDRILGSRETPAEEGQKAIIDSSTENRINDIISNGVFVATGNGVGLRDPYTGQFVAGPNGKPLTLSFDEVLAKAQSAKAQAANPVSPAPPSPVVSDESGAGVRAPLTQQETDQQNYGKFSDMLPGMTQ